MVRVQRVIESIHTTESPRAPARLYVKAYQADLERLREVDRCSDENIFLHMQYLIADMHIAELALADLAESKGASLSGRLEDLHNCVEALKALCKLSLLLQLLCMSITAGHVPAPLLVYLGYANNPNSRCVLHDPLIRLPTHSLRNVRPIRSRPHRLVETCCNRH